MSRVFDLAVDIGYGAKVHHTEYLRPITRGQAMLATGSFVRGLLVGRGTFTADATGDISLARALKVFAPIPFDNRSAQFSGFVDSNDNGATRICRFTYLIRVSNAAITFTPKVLNGSTIPTISTDTAIAGEAACAATDEDYSGTDQIQPIDLTMPSAFKWYLPIGTIGGIPVAGMDVDVTVLFDHYIETAP
jgi:hypothetical protein